MLKAWNQNRWESLLAVLVSLIYIYIGYFLNRSHFSQLFSGFLVGFCVYVFFIKRANQTNHFNFFLTLGILFRVLFLFSTPTLSDDYFRFIWDGQLLLNGLNPFDLPPSEVSINFPNKTELLAKMNSPNYYTVYPPVAQIVYFTAAWLSPNSIWGSIIVMRGIILLSEIGIIFLLPTFLKHLSINKNNSLWYILNPLVIVELTGNLHFEGIVLFFFLLAAYLLVIHKEKLGAIAWALASATKLIPIFFLPLIVRKYPLKKAFVFYAFFGLAFIGLWIPLYNSTLISHFLESIRLYSKTFEFNASIYYLVRAIGYQLMGYNIIHTAGPWLSNLAYLGILIILLKKRVIHWNQFFTLLLLALSWYYLLALIIHPWYSITLIFLAVFTHFRYPMLWSFLAVLSYWAYSNPEFQENFWLISIEYFTVIGFALYELLTKKNSAYPKLNSKRS